MTSLLTLAFSRDRPLQLEALVDSLTRHTHGWAGKVRTLYRATTPASADAYRALAGRRPTTLALEHDEEDWHAQVRRHVASAEFVLLVVDDTIFVEDWDAGEVTRALRAHPEIAGVSLRLGRNVTYCYAIDRPESFPNDAVRLEGEAGLWTYEWEGREGDFGYPLEVSSSVYRSADVLRWLAEAPARRIRSPNSLEAWLSGHRQRAPKRLARYETSRAFSAPWNSVQVEFQQNRHAGQSPNDWLSLEGWRLDVAQYDGYLPKGVHEVPPVWMTRRSGAEGELDGVDGVVFINLDRRPDRQQHIEHQLLDVARMNPSRVCRLRACDEPQDPSVGCMKSHIAAIEVAQARRWRVTLVVEDDFTWAQPLDLARLRSFLDSNRHDFALALLASSNVVPAAGSPEVAGLQRIARAQNAAGYLVHDSAHARILQVWQEALPRLAATGEHWNYMHDVAWHGLMVERPCFAFLPPLGYQKPGHSDLSGQWVDHSGGAV